MNINDRSVWLSYNVIGAVAQRPYDWGVGSAFQSYNNLHQKMPTLDTQNAHAGGSMPTQEDRHSRQKQQQKPPAWACHQSEVHFDMPWACSANTFFLREMPL